ncbi:MAG: hypothetical protein WCI92_16260 [Bacteroidota bacterium]
MDDTNESPEPKKVAYHPMPTPEQLKKDQELIDQMLKAANQKVKEKGWCNEGNIPNSDNNMQDIQNQSSHAKNVPASEAKQVKLLLAGFKIIDSSINMGIYKFGDIVSKINQIGVPVNDDLLIALKRVYGSYLADHDNPLLDDINTLRSFKLPKTAENDQSPEPKKVPYHPMPTPEELKQLDEELAAMVKAANEYTKAQGWQD